jgi:diguanylate cyclase (GGDEF)-like protein
MGFAGKPSQDIKNTIHRLNRFAVVVCVCICVCMVILSAFITGRLLRIQNHIIKYIDEIDKGDFNHTMAGNVCKRRDEYGILGRAFVQLNDSLGNLIQNDALTGLYNRRAAMQYLNKYVADANEVDGKPFCFVIGDIDFFKKVNDTYGHNCGDEVLRRVSEILGRVSGDEGFASRWGGEEFVIAFRCGLEPTLQKLQAILDEIREMTVDYGDYHVKITMTFGVKEYVAPYQLDWLISNADILLYKGKESGRNQIVS